MIEPKYYVCKKLLCWVEEFAILMTQEINTTNIKCPSCQSEVTEVAPRNYSPKLPSKNHL